MTGLTPSSPTTAAPSSRDALLTLQQVCDLLGVSHRTLRRWRRDGRLMAVRIAGTVRVRESDLEHALRGSPEERNEAS